MRSVSVGQWCEVGLREAVERLDSPGSMCSHTSVYTRALQACAEHVLYRINESALCLTLCYNSTDGIQANGRCIRACLWQKLQGNIGISASSNGCRP